MNVKKVSLNFPFKCCKTLFFLRDSGSEFQTVGPKNRERSFPKVLKKDARNCQPRGVKRTQRPRGTAWMKKVRNRRCHTVLIDTLKTETRIFVLNPSLHWKPVKCLSSAVALACLDL